MDAVDESMDFDAATHAATPAVESEQAAEPEQVTEPASLALVKWGKKAEAASTFVRKNSDAFLARIEADAEAAREALGKDTPWVLSYLIDKLKALEAVLHKHGIRVENSAAAKQ